MNKRRSFEIEVIEILLSVAIIVLTVVLFFKSGELTILFPIEFGLAAVLSILYALEGLLYNRNRVIRKTRLIIFGILAAVLIFFTVVSAISIAK